VPVTAQNKVDPTTGAEAWKLELNAGGIRCPPRLTPDSIYITTGDPDDTKSGEAFTYSRLLILVLIPGGPKKG